MLFQDGHAWLDPEAAMRAPTVFDNLIHRGEMPVTVGVFIDPGIFRSELPAKLGWGRRRRTEVSSTTR
jgi:enterochelin esterase-like enzyme